MDRGTFIADGEAKIEALFEGVAEHSSASIIDVKNAFKTFLQHLAGDAEVDAVEAIDGLKSSEPPAGTALTAEELAANHVEENHAAADVPDEPIEDAETVEEATPATEVAAEAEHVEPAAAE